MKILKTGIIPNKLWYVDIKKKFLIPANFDYGNETLDLESIAFFAATGFFFNDRTYYKNIKVIPPASILEIDDINQIQSIRSYWEWYYNPIIRDVEEATEIFKVGFERNLFKAIEDKEVILPLSGGIDSRTIAAALPDGMANLKSYSYEFQGGVKENFYGKSIAKIKKMPFQEFYIPQGYLWDKIDELSKIVNHESEYIHSRQISVLDDLEKLGEIFVLGHGGEIFKGLQVPKDISTENLSDHAFEIFVNEEGLELGEELWKLWGLKGNLNQFIRDTFYEYLNKIKIKEPNPRLRAFFYKYIASRKNQVNVNIFARKNEIYLPFLNHDVLNVTCNFHEDIVTGRKVQINYIKQKSPDIASIPWQNYYPLNLYNYHRFYKKDYVPFRAVNYLKRVMNEKINGKLIIRNWENQLIGKENEILLQNFLFNDDSQNILISKNIVKEVYHKFKYLDNKKYIFPLSILITLSYFQKKRIKYPNLQLEKSVFF